MAKLKTLPLFELGEPLPDFQRIPHEDRCIPAGERNGRGPAGEKCGSCAHLRRVGNDRKYLKCGLAAAAWTRGAGSDIFAGWPACEFWQSVEEAGDR
jgi:hypothetical protein